MRKLDDESLNKDEIGVGENGESAISKQNVSFQKQKRKKERKEGRKLKIGNELEEILWSFFLHGVI